MVRIRDQLSALVLLATSGACVSGPSPAAACGAPMSNWSTLAAVPASTSERPVNVLSLDAASRLRWNGTAVTEERAREYLGIIPTFVSANLTVLAPHPDADCEAVSRMRQLMDEQLRCGPSSCAEVR